MSKDLINKILEDIGLEKIDYSEEKTPRVQ